ncbi:MAG: thiamine-phosphate kinase [Proteobacteria bacterium]|nr:MAG: thiamine-phosphate kinase [Pseudomonadota bacterium]
MGDDAFVYKSFSDHTVIAQDMMIQDVHFKTEYFSAADLGYKSLAVNLSDFAAMGAKPHFAHVSLALPKPMDDVWIQNFYEGMTSLADAHGVEVVGGDLSLSPGPIIIDVNLTGEVKTPFTRGNAQAGDFLAVTGPLGVSHAGMLALQKELYIFAESTQKHLRPKPRLDVMDLLTKNNFGPEDIHAVMDCSDGLINDVSQMAKPKNLGLRLSVADFPIESDAEGFALSLSQSALQWFLWGGEDYELLMAVSPQKKDELKFVFENNNMDLFFIGKFNDSATLTLQSADGTVEEITEFQGWSHF